MILHAHGILDYVTAASVRETYAGYVIEVVLDGPGCVEFDISAQGYLGLRITIDEDVGWIHAEPTSPREEAWMKTPFGIVAGDGKRYHALHLLRGEYRRQTMEPPIAAWGNEDALNVGWML